MSKRAVFTDFDGCVRLIPSLEDDDRLIIPPPEFCPVRLSLLAKTCIENDIKMVVSSDLRTINELEGTDNREDVRKWIQPYFPWSLVHEDWATPIRGHRWKEIEIWLAAHPEVTQYAILEDSQVHFDKASEFMKSRIVWCNNRFGFVPTLAYQLESLFGNETNKDKHVFGQDPNTGDSDL